MTSRRNILQVASAAAAMGSSAIQAGETHETKKPSTDSEKFREAVVTGDLPTVTAMLDHDPALRYARDAEGVSVYILACLKGQPKVAEELTRRGVVLDIFEAAVSGNINRAKDVVKEDPGAVHHRLPDGRTALRLAAEGGKTELVVFLATGGSNLSAGPDTPLLAAVDYPDHTIAADMSRFLLMNASDPNAKRRDGKTVLHLAAARGSADLTEAVIHRGANVEARDVDGKTPLDVATGEAVAVLQNASKVERVYFMRRYTQDLRGNPATREDTYGIPQAWINEFVTIAHRDFEKVKQMYKLCPTLLMTRATWDELAIEAAAHMGLAPMAQFLADAGSTVSTCTATLVGAGDLVKRLVREDSGCLRERGAHDIALLAYTAWGNQQPEIAEFLLKSGADVHAKALGQTTLHIAATKGHVELAKVLLEHGADVNATAMMRGTAMTPLAFAQRAKQEKMADFLRERGGRS
jgi:ankyrin repeat protein